MLINCIPDEERYAEGKEARIFFWLKYQRGGPLKFGGGDENKMSRLLASGIP